MAGCMRCNGIVKEPSHEILQSRRLLFETVNTSNKYQSLQGHHQILVPASICPEMLELIAIKRYLGNSSTRFPSPACSLQVPKFSSTKLGSRPRQPKLNGMEPKKKKTGARCGRRTLLVVVTSCSARPQLSTLTEPHLPGAIAKARRCCQIRLGRNLKATMYKP